MTITENTNPRPENEPSPIPPPLTPQPGPSTPSPTPPPPPPSSSKPAFVEPSTAPVRVLVENFLRDNPRLAFNTREIAVAIGRPLNSTSATISAYLPFMKVSVAREEFNGARALRYYQFDPAKEVDTTNMNAVRNQRRTVRRSAVKPKQTARQTPRPPQQQAIVPVVREEFARVLFREGRNIVLITVNNELIKGKVMAE